MGCPEIVVNSEDRSGVFSSVGRSCVFSQLRSFSEGLRALLSTCDPDLRESVISAAWREMPHVYYCPFPVPEAPFDGAGTTADCLTGLTTNSPEAEVPGISVFFGVWPDLAFAMVML